MELAFETAVLRRICESDTEARKRFPERTVEELHARLADMRAASSASDLVAGKPSFGTQPPGRIKFGLDGGYELVCIGNHPKPPLTDGGLVNFSRVRRVKIIMIAQEPENE